MNRGIALSLASLLAVGSHAKERAPADLREVRNGLYCLTHGPFRHLSDVDETAIPLVFSKDSRSKPGERHLFLFVKRARGAYDMFDVVINPHDYEIANNATLKARHGADYGGVDFVEESLGGIWTHGFIAENFLRALKTRPVVLSSKLPRNQRPWCSSFATPNRYR